MDTTWGAFCWTYNGHVCLDGVNNKLWDSHSFWNPDPVQEPQQEGGTLLVEEDIYIA